MLAFHGKPSRLLMAQRSRSSGCLAMAINDAGVASVKTFAQRVGWPSGGCDRMLRKSVLH